MSIAVYMSWGVHMHTINKLTESNIGSMLDEFLVNSLDICLDKLLY